jgi:hypothetical protein
MTGDHRHRRSAEHCRLAWDFGRLNSLISAISLAQYGGSGRDQAGAASPEQAETTSSAFPTDELKWTHFIPIVSLAFHVFEATSLGNETSLGCGV